MASIATSKSAGKLPPKKKKHQSAKPGKQVEHLAPWMKKAKIVPASGAKAIKKSTKGHKKEPKGGKK